MSSDSEQNNKLKKSLTSEKALIIEAAITCYVLYWLLGFEITVIAALSIIIGYVVKLWLDSNN